MTQAADGRSQSRNQPESENVAPSGSPLDTPELRQEIARFVTLIGHIQADYQAA